VLDVELRSVSKAFGRVLAIDRIDLGVRKGEFLSLLGPSGSGKTTTLRVIAGLVEPSAGEVLIGGRVVTRVPVHRRNLGMVFQNYALFPHLTVLENVAFGLEMRGVSRAEIARRAGETLALVRLPGFEARYPHQLSGGQRQRVALARALVVEPSVLLLDEPLGALDKKLRESMQVELRVLQRSLGITTVFVTHDQEEALTLSDRIAVMNEGRIEQLDTPVELYERPRNRFVSEFIGASNFLEGEVAAEEGPLTCLRTAKGLMVWLPTAAVATGNRARVAVSVRPEKITLSLEPPAEGRNAFAATVENVVYLGTSTHYYVVTEAGERLTVYEQNVAAHGGKMLYAPGDRVHVGWQPASTLAVVEP
jgi:putative spermidine/putrescine transport system ATP-binding protein/spermidine/putrescine transport system ATP-binding protein